MFRLIKSLFLLNRRLAENKERQTSDGYTLDTSSIGPERYVTYSEGHRKIEIVATFSFSNDVRLYVDSLRKWTYPYGEEVSSCDFDRVLSRTIQYLSCWGRVELDYSHFEENDDVKNSLRKQGIEFEEIESGVIVYSIDTNRLKQKSRF